MGRDWIDEEVRQTEAREAEIRAVFERHRTKATAVKEQGPRLMRDLVEEVAAAVDEYRRKVPSHAEEIRFQQLPHEGFSVAKAHFPSAFLECRPDYSSQTVYCNRNQTDAHESEPKEWAFDLYFVLDGGGNVGLRHDGQRFASVSAAVEFLLRPVLFPRVTDQD